MAAQRIYYLALAAMILATILQVSGQSMFGFTVTATSRPCWNVTPQKGSIEIVPFGGVAPYTLIVNSGAPTTSTSFTNLNMGEISIVLSDSSNPPQVYADVYNLLPIPPVTVVFDITASQQGKPGSGSGSIAMVSVNGDGPFTYYLEGPSSATESYGSFSMLLSGPYKVTVTDSWGCSAQFPVLVPPDIILDTTAIQSTCADVATGVVKGEVSELNYGTPPYTFFLMPGQNRFRIAADAIIVGPTANRTVLFEHLTSGDWTILVYDSALGTTRDFNGRPGYFYRDWDYVTQLPDFSAVFTYDADDSGAGDGQVTVTVFSGTGPFDIYLNGDLQQSTTFSNLRKGTYSVRIVDVGSGIGCSKSYQFFVAQTLVVNVTDVQPTCNTAGRISLSISGGEEPYEIRLLPLPGEETREPQRGTTLTGVPVGDRTIVVVDSRGVKAELNVTVPFVQNGVNITHITTTNTTSSTSKDGTAVIHVINANIGTVFTVVSRDGLGFYKQINGTFTGLAMGIYSVEARDPFGCSAVSEFQIGSDVSVYAYASSAACISSTIGNGRITAQFAYGAMPYNVTLGTENVLLFQTSYDFENLVAGSYSISIVDAVGTNRSFVVDVPSYVFDADSAWKVTPPGAYQTEGLVFFSYIWQQFEWRIIDATGWISSQDLSNWRLQPGTYTLETRDSRGCLATKIFEVPSLFTLSASGIAYTGTYCDKTRSRVTLTTSGGIGPFRYRIAGSSWQDSPIFDGLAPGLYIFEAEYTLTGSAFVAVSSLYVNPAPRPLPFTIQSISEDPVSESSLGTFTVVVNDPDPTSDKIFRYVIDGDRVFSSSTITGVPAGEHTISVFDSANCTASQLVYMPTRLNASIIAVTDRCFATKSGAAGLDIQGGRPPYTIIVDGTIMPVGSYVPGLDAGDHVVMIQDSSPTTQTVTLSFSVGTLPPVLSGESGMLLPLDVSSDGLIWLNTTGFSGPYEYRLSPGFTFFQTENAFAVAPGSWVIEAKDVHGCIESKLFTVVLPLAPAISCAGCTEVTPSSSNSVLATVCPGGSSIDAVVAIGGGFAPIMLSVDNGPFTADINLLGLKAGQHELIVKDSLERPQIVKVAFTVAEHDPIRLSFITYPDSASGVPDGSLAINATRNDSSVTFTYQAGATAQPTNEFAGLPAGDITVLVTDSDGCTATSQVTIPMRTLYVQSLTSPTCFGESSGSITVNYSSTFTLPVNIYLVGYGLVDPVNLTASNLPAGMYEFRLNDSSVPPIESRIFVELTQPPKLISSVYMNQWQQFWLTGHGGSPPYTHHIRTISFSPVEHQSVDPIAAYQAYWSDIAWDVTDAKGCKVSGYQYGIPQLKIVLSGKIWPSCSNSPTGSFSWWIDGGLPTYSVAFEALDGQLENIPPVNHGIGSQSVRGLSPGRWLMKVTDVTDRMASTIITVGSLNVAFTASGFAPSIAADGTTRDDGSIYLYPADYGLAPFVFRAVGRFTYSAYDYPYQFVNLPADNYTVEMFAYGCTASQTVSLVPVFSAKWDFSTLVNPHCGNDNGGIKIDARGGVPPYSFLWADGAYTSASRNDLAAGVYSVIVRDSSNPPHEVALPPLTLSAAAPPSLRIVTRDVDRSVDFGVINVYVQNFVSTISVFIDGAPANLGYNPNMRPGEHEVVVQDAAGCRVSQIASTRTKTVVARVDQAIQAACCDQNASVVLESNPSWEYARVDQEIWQDSPLFENLTPGRLYRFWVREKSDPGDMADVSFVPSQPTCFAILGVVPLRRRTTASGLVRVTYTPGSFASIQVDSNEPQVFASTTLTFGDVLVPIPAGFETIETSHTIAAWNLDGCKSTVSIRLDPPLIVDQEIVENKCSGDMSGSVSLRMTSGVPPFSIYEGFSSEPTNNTYWANLDSGSYVYRVTDSGMPSSTVSVLAAIPIRPAWDLFDVDLAFREGLVFYAAPTGGIAPMTYILAPHNDSSANITQTSAAFAIKEANIYNLTVIDAVGCRKDAQVRIHSPLNGVVSFDNRRCVNTYITYTLVITPSGGSGFYEVASSFPAFTSDLSGLTVSWPQSPHPLIRDVKTGVIVSLEASDPMASWKQLSITVEVTAATGTIVVTATGGISPYTYQLDSGTGQVSNTFSGMTAGSYVVIVTDAAGCTDQTTAWVPDNGLLTASVDQASGRMCDCGVSNGKIVVQANGGTIPYTFYLDGVEQASNVFDGVSGGDHNISVRDSVGLFYNMTQRVFTPPPITLSWSLGYEQGLYNYRLVARVAGGFSLPYFFSLNGTRVGITNYNFIPISIRSYGPWELTASTSANCSATTTVHFYPQHVVTATPSPVSCNGLSDGAINITVSRGSGVFSYRLNQGAAVWSSDSYISNLAAGTYEVQVLDNLTGALVTSYATVQQPGVLVIAAQASRFSDATSGSLNFAVSGGSRPYSLNVISIGDGQSWISEKLNWPFLATGQYNATVTDFKGCTATLSSLVSIYTEVYVQATVTDALCFGDSNGEVLISASGGNGDYMYSLAKAGTINMTALVWQSSPSLTGLSAGTYVAFVKDSALPEQVFANYSIAVKQPQPLVIGYVSTGTDPGGSTAVVDLAISGGTLEYMLDYPPYLFGWFVYNSNPVQATGVPAGTTTASVTDKRGCTASIGVTVYDKVVVSVDSVTHVTCRGASTGSVSLIAAGGSGQYRYKAIQRGVESSFQSSPVFYNLTAGTYDFLVEDPDAYSALITGVVINEPVLSLQVFAAQVKRSSSDSASGSFVAVATGAQGPAQFALDGGAFVLDPNFAGIAAGEHELVVEDSVGCQAASTIRVTSIPQALFTTSAPTCAGRSDGAVTISMIGGLSPFTYTLLPLGTVQTSSQFSSLAAGNWTVRVQDSFLDGNNVYEFNFTISEANPIVVSYHTLERSSVVRASVSGGAGGPYRWVPDDGFAVGEWRDFRGPFPTTRTVIDSADCPLRVEFEAVGYFQTSIVDVLETCVGAGPSTVQVKVRTTGGLGPYTHYGIESGTYTDDEWIPIPPRAFSSINSGIRTFDSFNRGYSAFAYVSVDGVPAALNAYDLRVYPTTGIGNSDGVVSYSLGSPLYRRTAEVTYVRNSDQVTTVRTANMYNTHNLPSGDYTATVALRGCSYSFNFTINDPPTPLINGFSCVINPQSQVFKCDWTITALETYQLSFALVIGNTSDVPPSEAFVPVFSGVPYSMPVSFSYVPARLYYAKLISYGPGGATESAIYLEANIAKPLAPTRVFAEVRLEGVAISWDQPQDPVPSHVVFDVHVWANNQFFMVASDVEGLSTFVNASVMDSVNIVSPGQIFSFAVISRSLTFDLSSPFPRIGDASQSALFRYVRTPLSPVMTTWFANPSEMDSLSFGRCVGRCALVSFTLTSDNAGGDSLTPVRMLLEYKYSTADDSSYEAFWQVESTPRFFKVALPQLAFGFYVTLRLSVQNAVGLRYSYVEMVNSEPPQIPSLWASAAPTGDLNYTQVTLSCRDGSLAAGVQASVFRYEYVNWPHPDSPDWSVAITSPEINGPMVYEFRSNDTYLFARCSAINSAGETLSSPTRTYLPPPFLTPTNLRIESDVRSGNVLLPQLKWDFSYPVEVDGGRVSFELKIYGADCSSAVKEVSGVIDPFYYVSTRHRCGLGFAVRARNLRGTTAWSEDIFTTVNFQPDPPAGIYADSFPSAWREPTAPVSLIVVLDKATALAQALISIQVEMLSQNATGGNWTTVFTANSAEFSSYPLRFSQPQIVFPLNLNLSVNSRTMCYSFRASVDNGLKSTYTTFEGLISGEPTPPTSLAGQILQFDPVNTTMLFTWNPSKLDGAYFNYTLTYTSPSGESNVTMSSTNASTLSLQNISAGVTVSLELYEITHLYRSVSVTVSVLAASGSYWPLPASALRPSLTRLTPTSAIVSWNEDKTNHGHPVRSYSVLFSADHGATFSTVTTLTNPDVTVGVVSYEFSTYYVDGGLFAIVPSNPLGSGPQSDPSDPMDFRPDRRERNLMLSKVSRQTVVSSETTSFEITWQPVSRATNYKFSISNSFNIFEINELEAPCCNISYIGYSSGSYEYRASFYDPLHGWLPDTSSAINFGLDSRLVESIQFDSLNHTGRNSSGAFLDVRFALPKSLLSGINMSDVFVVQRHSISGLGVWEESIAKADTCFERTRSAGNVQFLCSSRFWYAGSLSDVLDVQIAAASSIIRSAWTKQKTIALADLPAPVFGWLEESDAALRHPNASSGAELRLPLRWNNQHPLGSDVAEYQIKVYTTYPGLDSNVLAKLVFQQNFAPTADMAASAPSFEIWLPLAFGTNQKIFVYGRNSAGWALILEKGVCPFPPLPIDNMRVSNSRRFDYRSGLVTVSWDVIMPSYLPYTYYLHSPDVRENIGEYVSQIGGRTLMSIPACRRLSSNPFKLSCSVDTPIRYGTVLNAAGSVTYSVAALQLDSPFRNASVSTTRSLAFPGMWNDVLTPSSNMFLQPAIVVLSCFDSRLGSNAFVSNTNGSRFVWKVLNIGLRSDYWTQSIETVKLTQTWRDGSLPPSEQVLDANGARIDFLNRIGRYQLYDVRNPPTMMLEVPFLEQGGIVDIQATIYELRSYYPQPPVIVPTVSFVTCFVPSHPRAPIKVDMLQPVISDGLCRLPVRIEVDGITGSVSYSGIRLLSERWSFSRRPETATFNRTRVDPLGDTYFPIEHIQFDAAKKTYSLTLNLPADNYVHLYATLFNEKNMESHATKATFGPVFCGPLRSFTIYPTRNYTSTQGVKQVRMNLTPALPDWFEASPVVRVMVDGTVYAVSYNNATSLDIPALPAGEHSISISLDGAYYGPAQTLTSVALPMSPIVSAPNYFDVRRPGLFATFSMVGFKGLKEVFCFWETTRVEATFNEDRDVVNCELPVFNWISPQSIPVFLSLDGTNTSTLASTVFWDSNLVSIVRSYSSTDDPNNAQAATHCSSYGSSTLFVSVSRWPYVPASRPLYAYFTSATGSSDPFNCTLTWDDTKGMFSTPFPYVVPDNYDFLIGDGDDLRFGRGSFRHTADCTATTQAAMVIKSCDVCIQSRIWAYKPGGFGLCAPPSDASLLTSIGFSLGCPAGYLGAIEALDPLFLNSNATDLRVLVRARLTVVNPTGFLSGSGTFAFVSRWYPIVAQRNGTFEAAISASSQVTFSTMISIDPYTATLGQEVELRISFPGQFPRSLLLTIPFRPGASLLPPEFSLSGRKMMILSEFGSYNPVPYFVAQFANPELVVSVRSYITAYEDAPITGPRVRTVEVDQQFACRTCSTPTFRRYFRAKVIPSFVFDVHALYSFPVYPGVHRFNLVINQGLPSEETVSQWFAVFSVPDARSVLAHFANGGSFSDQCNDPISKFQACFEMGTNYKPSTYFPGSNYPEGGFVKMGLVINSPLPIGLPEAASDVAPVKFAIRYSHQLWFRGEQTFSGYGEGQIRLPITPPVPGVQASAGIIISIVVEQEFIGVEIGQYPETRNIKITAAGLVVAAIQIPVYRTSMGPIEMSVDVFFSLAIGPTQEFCNQVARPQPRCDVDPVADRPGWTVAPGYLMEIRARAQATAGIRFLFSVSIWTEFFFRTGSIRHREGDVVVHDSGVQVGFKVCGSMTVLFYTKRYCAYEYTYTEGTMPANSLSWKKRTLLHTSWELMADEGWTHQFQQLAPAMSWSSKKKRSISVVDYGTIVSNTIPSSNPTSAAGIGSSRGLALVAWSGVDSSRPLPQGGVAVFSLYNSSTESLTDPVWLRNTADSDSPAQIVALPNGKFLVLFTSIPDQGTTTDPTIIMSKTEMMSVVFDPLTLSWTTPTAITSDAQYFDGVANAVVFSDPTTMETRVLAVWIRSIDSMLDATNQKQFMWSVFAPTTGTWTTPQVLINNIVARVPASLSVVNNTILMTFIDDNAAANQSVAYMHLFHIASLQWAAQPVAIGRGYQFESRSDFNYSKWEANSLYMQQNSIVGSKKDFSSFIVVWTDQNAILSRIYNLTTLSRIFDGSSTHHPEVQLLWMREGALPRELTVLTVPDGAQVGQIVSWTYSAGGQSTWLMTYMRQASSLWETSAIEARHDLDSNVLHTTMFSASSDTAFAILASQEVLTYANKTEYLGQSAIEYKRINLLPMLEFEDGSISLAAFAIDSPYEMRVVVRNKGLLPSEAAAFTVTQGDLWGPSSSAPSATIQLPSVGPGQFVPLLVPRTPVAPLQDGGYIWAVIANSSVPALRLPVFSAQIKAVLFSPAQSDNVEIKVDVVCTSLLPTSSSSRDRYALAPVHFYTKGSGSGVSDQKLMTMLANCSLDGVSTTQVAWTMNPLTLVEKLAVSISLSDDFTPESRSVLANTTRLVTVGPDLQLYGANQVQFVDPFLGRARFVVEVYNGGLLSSKNITVNVTVDTHDGSMPVIASVFIPSISALSQQTLELPLGTYVIKTPGNYNFTIQAGSALSKIANDIFAAQVAANATDRTPLPDYEFDMADNTRFLYNTEVFGAWKPRFEQSDVYIRAQPLVEMKLWIANAALDTPAVNVPVRFYIDAENLAVNILGEAVLSFLNTSSSTVLSLTPSQNASMILSQLQLLANPRLIVSIPAYYSGSTSTVEVVVPLQLALTNPAPSTSKLFAGEPGLVVPSLIYLGANETLALTVASHNFVGQVSVRQTGGQEYGVQFNNATMLLSFNPNSLPSLPFTVSSSLALFLPSGVLYESYVTTIIVGAVPASIISLPPPPATVETAPIEPSLAPFAAPDVFGAPLEQPPQGAISNPPDNTSQTGGAGAAIGAAIGVIAALLLIVFVAFAIIFARRKHKGEGGESVKLFFTPWKADPSQNAVVMAPVGASSSPKAAVKTDTSSEPESSEDSESEQNSDEESEEKSEVESEETDSDSDASDEDSATSSVVPETSEEVDSNDNSSASPSDSHSESVHSSSEDASRSSSFESEESSE